ncbi:hypothetical protein GCM10010174_28040 [Kutzneria viridogrisea]
MSPTGDSTPLTSTVGTTASTTTTTAPTSTTVTTTLATTTTTSTTTAVAAPPPPPPVTHQTTAPQPAQTACGANEYRNVDGNCVHRPEAAPGPPAGATAQCKDSTYSFSQHRQGTCSGHGGVSRWL